MSRENRSLKKRSKKFILDVVIHTPVIKMTFLLVTLWMLFSAGIYFGEQGAEGATITSYGKALYWGIAAFSTAGIADMPKSGISELIGAIWIILASFEWSPHPPFLKSRPTGLELHCCPRKG